MAHEQRQETAADGPAPDLRCPPSVAPRAKAHAAMLSHSGGKIASQLPLGADVDDFRRVLRRRPSHDGAAQSPRGRWPRPSETRDFQRRGHRGCHRALQAAHELTNCILSLEADEALAAAKAAMPQLPPANPWVPSPAFRSPTRTCSTAKARSQAGARVFVPTRRPRKMRPPSPAARLLVPCKSPPCI